MHILCFFILQNQNAFEWMNEWTCTHTAHTFVYFFAVNRSAEFVVETRSKLKWKNELDPKGGGKKLCFFYILISKFSTIRIKMLDFLPYLDDIYPSNLICPDKAIQSILRYNCIIVFDFGRQHFFLVKSRIESLNVPNDFSIFFLANINKMHFF